MHYNPVKAPSFADRLLSKKVTKLMAISFAILALMVQLVSGVAFPGDSSVAEARTAPNQDHIISGGFSNKNDLLAIYDANKDQWNHRDIKQIYNQYGVSREDIVKAQDGYFNTNDFNGQLKVLGRQNHGVSNRQAVKIDGTNTTIYTGGWLDGYNQKPWKYKALVGKRASDGKWFAIMYDCGNIVYKDEPKPLPKPAAACKVVLWEKLNRTQVRVAANAEVSGGAEIQNYKFVILKDGKEVNTRTVTTNAKSAYIEYDTANSGGEGTYTAKAGVNTTVGYKTSADCEKTFTIAPEPVKNIKVCETATKKIVTINEKDFDESKHSKDLDDCKVVPVEKNIEVCELSSMEVITIKESEFDAEKHSKNLDDCEVVTIEVCELATKEVITIDEKEFDSEVHSKNLEDCEEEEVVTPVEKNIEVCELATKDVVTIKESEFNSETYSTDLEDCAEEPVVTPVEETTPPELPRTGVVDGISGLLGLGSIIAAAGYYSASRRNLLATLLER